jgi:nitrite reductase/ring-hydroxylating ferredoxin subunit
MSGDPTVLCRLDELADPGARAVTLGSGDWPLRAFVVRQGEQAFAYVNRCPHMGHPLNAQPHWFLNADESLIQCASHGALFAIDSGYCVAGPCARRQLIAIAVQVTAGLVVLKEDPDDLARRFG